MSRILAFSVMAIAACSPCPATDLGDSPAADSWDTGTPGDEALTAEEIAALGTWTERTASLAPVEGGDAVEGDRIAILLPEGSVEQLDLVTTLTRGQDYNSSRSNKTGSTWAGDDFGDDDTATADHSIAWDGRDPCEVLPCASNARPDGAVSALTVDPGDGALAMRWGETTSMDETFSGYVALGCKGCGRGHVTVLKAAATDDGTIEITSALDSKYVAIFLNGDAVYEGAPAGDSTPIATIRGVTGATWPSAFSVDETALGTLISLGW